MNTTVPRVQIFFLLQNVYYVTIPLVENAIINMRSFKVKADIVRSTKEQPANAFRVIS
jgi:hypothetical protein